VAIYKNGRIRAEEITIKSIGDLQLIFWDKETIYLVDKKRGMRYIFHRWFAPRASYDEWRHFRDLLWKTKNPNLLYYFEKAAIYGIEFTTTNRKVDINDKKVRYI